MPKKMHGGRNKKQIPGRKISHVVLGSRFSLERWLLNTQKADVFGCAAEKLLESDMVPSINNERSMVSWDTAKRT